VETQKAKSKKENRDAIKEVHRRRGSNLPEQLNNKKEDLKGEKLKTYGRLKKNWRPVANTATLLGGNYLLDKKGILLQRPTRFGQGDFRSPMGGGRSKGTHCKWGERAHRISAVERQLRKHGRGEKKQNKKKELQGGNRKTMTPKKENTLRED